MIKLTTRYRGSDPLKVILPGGMLIPEGERILLSDGVTDDTVGTVVRSYTTGRGRALHWIGWGGT